jgi:hypothetical protein
MKSILAQQPPQRSPWAPARLRQEMQTGGSKRSAASASMPRKVPTAKKALGRTVGMSEVISAPSIAMTVMIERGWGQ